MILRSKNYSMNFDSVLTICKTDSCFLFFFLKSKKLFFPCEVEHLCPDVGTVVLLSVEKVGCEI